MTGLTEFDTLKDGSDMDAPDVLPVPTDDDWLWAGLFLVGAALIILWIMHEWPWQVKP